MSAKPEWETYPLAAQYFPLKTEQLQLMCVSQVITLGKRTMKSLKELLCVFWKLENPLST
jgi:hypothetical protein